MNKKKDPQRKSIGVQFPPYRETNNKNEKKNRSRWNNAKGEKGVSCIPFREIKRKYPGVGEGGIKRG